VRSKEAFHGTEDSFRVSEASSPRLLPSHFSLLTLFL
jgi:hypothetical protein